MQFNAHFKQFALYILSGGTAAVVDFGVYVLLVYNGAWYIAASITSSILAFFTAFLLHKYIVFRKKDSFVKHLGKYFTVDVINTVISNVLLYLFVEHIGLDKEIAKICAMGTVVLWNYFIYKYVVYV